MTDDQEVEPHHPAKPDISVTLKVYFQDATKTIIGYLIEICQTSLILEYLPLNSHFQEITNMRCTATLKTPSESKRTSLKVHGTIDSDELAPHKSFFGFQARRCKVVFADQVRLPEIEPFILQ